MNNSRSSFQKKKRGVISSNRNYYEILKNFKKLCGFKKNFPHEKVCNLVWPWPHLCITPSSFSLFIPAMQYRKYELKIPSKTKSINFFFSFFTSGKKKKKMKMGYPKRHVNHFPKPILNVNSSPRENFLKKKKVYTKRFFS